MILGAEVVEIVGRISIGASSISRREERAKKRILEQLHIQKQRGLDLQEQEPNENVENVHKKVS